MLHNNNPGSNRAPDTSTNTLQLARPPYGKAQGPTAPRRAARLAGSEHRERTDQEGGKTPKSGTIGKLGKNTEIVSAPEKPAHQERRASRYELRETLADVSGLKRLGSCGRFRIKSDQAPEVRRRPTESGMVAHFAKLQLCGLIWVCPVCGPHLRQMRAIELDHACKWWMEKKSEGSVMLLTLTLPHDTGDTLEKTLGTVREGFTELVRGRAWQEDKKKYQITHYVRGHDCTVGPNGWHPHLHIVLLTETTLSRTELSELETRLYHRWARAVTARGLRPPTRKHGIKLEQARSRGDVARYVCQVVTGQEKERPRPIAYELTRGDLKTGRRDGHRTPWEVLSDFQNTGDIADLALWREWEEGTKGVHAIQWSRGLKKLVGITEQTDEELQAIEIGGEVVYTYKNKDAEWRAICETRNARRRVLEAAEHGGTIAVAKYSEEVLADWKRRRQKTAVNY